MKKFLNEFKEFALRGNVFDMAIGVVIGGAFTAIVNSIVSDIINPFIALVANTSNLGQLKYVLKPAIMNGDKVVKEALTLNYGSFIDKVIQFTIIAFIIFTIVKGVNRLMATKQHEPAPEPVKEDPKPSQEVILLQKIYEELKENNKASGK